jgi:uncharacterized protein YndB with AHSA1/START domain
MKKTLVYAAVGFVALLGLALLVGSLLPMGHRISRQGLYGVSPEVVWRAITDVEAFPSWRDGVERVERLPDRDGRSVWREHTSDGPLTFATERAEPPRLLVIRIADRNLPFGGTWTYEIAPAARGSQLTITEDGEIYNPLFRVMARFVFGYEATIETYLSSLQRHLQPGGNP